jgi:hypothetical protein
MRPVAGSVALLLVALAAPNLGFGASLAAGAAHSTVVKYTDGTVWAWGHNGSGRLGDNTTTLRSTPIQVGTSGNWLTSVTMVAAGAAHTLALKSNGSVVAWGSNVDGQVGDNTTATQRLSPVAVVGITGTVVGIAAGDFHSLAWTSDGKLYSWGRNSNGQMEWTTIAVADGALQVELPGKVKHTRDTVGLMGQMLVRENWSSDGEGPLGSTYSIWVTRGGAVAAGAEEVFEQRARSFNAQTAGVIDHIERVQLNGCQGRKYALRFPGQRYVWRVEQYLAGDVFCELSALQVGVDDKEIEKRIHDEARRFFASLRIDEGCMGGGH